MSSTKIQRGVITIYQGATFRWRMYLKDEDKVAIDLTDCHVVMQVRRSPRSEPALVEVSTFNNGIELLPQEGRIDIHVDHQITGALSLEEASYDVLVLWPDGDITRIHQGMARVVPGTSREWQAS